MFQTQLSGSRDLVLLSELCLKCEQLEVRKEKGKGKASSRARCRSLSSTLITRGCYQRFSTHLQTDLIITGFLSQCVKFLLVTQDTIRTEI